MTKDDLKKLEDNQSAQAAEIDQLRKLTITQDARLKQVEEGLSKQQIERPSRVARPEMDDVNVNKYGGQAGSSQESPRWLNVILHGIRKESDLDLVSFVISIGDALGMTVYKEDIRDVYRLSNRDPKSDRLPPVLVSFNRPYLRNNFLRRKFDLTKFAKFSDIYINADEPLETHRRKGLYRRIATAARSAGETVSMGQDWIKMVRPPTWRTNLTRSQTSSCHTISP